MPTSARPSWMFHQVDELSTPFSCYWLEVKLPQPYKTFLISQKNTLKNRHTHLIAAVNPKHF